MAWPSFAAGSGTHPSPISAAYIAVKLRIWLAFGSLCLLSGSGWLLKEWQPETAPGLFPIVVRSGLLALLFWVAEQKGPAFDPQSFPAGPQALLLAWSALVAALPTVAVVLAGEHVSPLTETLLFASLPTFVVFFAAQRAVGFGALESPLRLIAPALAGIAGAALLLPFNLPRSSAGQVWLLALLVTAAISAWAAIHLHQQLTGVPVLRAAATLSTSIFLLSAPLSLAQSGRFSSPLSIGSASAFKREILRSLLFDGPITLLTAWLLRDLSPIAFSSRFLLGIAVTIVEGYVLLRPDMNWTTALGLLLLFSSGAWLLAAGSRQEVS